MLHGGEIYGPTKVLHDFSVNINPLGIPENVYRRLAENKEALMQYPDQDCTALRQALAAFTGVPARRILCGNGASELIEAALQTIHPARILLTAPSFSGYRRAAENCGARILYHTLRAEEDFALTERILEDLENLGDPADISAAAPGAAFNRNLGAPVAGPSTGSSASSSAGASALSERPLEDMVILCSPSNPVGDLIDPALLDRIAAACARRRIWLMVDECFLGFIPDEKTRTMRRYLTKDRPGSRLLVLDAFTKRFAMPGIRLGYLMSDDTDLLQKIHTRQPEWSVSAPAQTAGLAALEDAAPYLACARRTIAAERARMAQALTDLGYHVFPGEANYIFFSTEPPLVQQPLILNPEEKETQDLARTLLQQGILIRNCSNYPGLAKGFYRIAVKLPEENEILLQALRGM